MVANNRFLFIFLTFFSIYAQAQIQAKDGFFDKFIIKIDTALYTSEKHLFAYQGEKYLFFKSITSQDICELTLHPHEDALIESVQLLNSTDFTIIDSLRHFDDKYFRGKIKFNDLESSKYLSLIFTIKLKTGKYVNYQMKLSSYQETSIVFDNEPVDLFVDEEKILELPCSNVYNIKMDGDFGDLEDDEIKLSASINAIKIKLKPKSLGTRVLTLKLKTIKPFVNEKGELSYDLPPIRIKVNAKPNRIDYINPERSTIYYNSDFKASEDIQFDHNRNMVLRKTYRIEDQQDNGGNLIAEIFTQSQVGNSNKIVCRLRTFALHRIHDGYLYIKDGDKTRFLTNFNIIDKPRIDDVSIMHDGEDWTNTLSAYPGEKVEIKIRGTGLLSSSFQFDGAENVLRDTTRLSDEVAFYILKVPVNISKKKINLFMNKISTQYSMQIREYQVPDEFDFVLINYGDKTVPLSSDFFNKPIFYDENIKDINITFDPTKIDEKGKLFGKQYINIDVKIFNSQNTLLEMQQINNVAICPGDNSPRSAYYDRKDCKTQSINLNDYLIQKTYSLDAFTQIYITITHSDGKYGTTGYTRKIKLILKKKIFFDLQVSFPAGLITKQINQSGYGNLYGISIAFLAQINFYDGERINRFKPYSIGGGFIALNAFNYATNANQDLGVVVLGTLVPLQSRKLSFPLYAGGGYLLKADTWFVLFGPGFRFSF